MKLTVYIEKELNRKMRLKAVKDEKTLSEVIAEALKGLLRG